MSKININLSDNLTAEITYVLEENDVIVTDFELTDGTTFELLQWLEEDGFDGILDSLSAKISDELALSFGELEDDEEKEEDEF